MDVDVAPVQPGKARLVVREWIRGQIDGQDYVKIPAIVDRCVGWIDTDPEFRARFLVEMLSTIVGDMVRGILSESRGVQVIVAGDSVFTPAGLKEAKRRKIEDRWSSWYEHSGTRTIRLLAMTKTELLAAAAERRARADNENRIAGLWERLAADLPEGVPLGTHYTPDQITTIAAELGIRPTLD